MHEVVLHLGSNIENREQYLEKGIALLDMYVGKVIRRSSIYETTAWGVTDQADFLNQAVLLRTSHTPLDILHKTQAIETLLDKKTAYHWGPRTLDIDIIFIDQMVIDYKDLQVPHPLLHKRKFVLEPLAEIIPNWNHPIQNQSNHELLNVCTDQSKVIKIT